MIHCCKIRNKPLFLSPERYKFPAVPRRVCGQRGGSHLHQVRTAGRDVSEPSQRHHTPGPPQRHGQPVVAQPERSPRQDAVSPGQRPLAGRGQDGQVSRLYSIGVALVLTAKVVDNCLVDCLDCECKLSESHTTIVRQNNNKLKTEWIHWFKLQCRKYSFTFIMYNTFTITVYLQLWIAQLDLSNLNFRWHWRNLYYLADYRIMTKQQGTIWLKKNTHEYNYSDRLWQQSRGEHVKTRFARATRVRSSFMASW